LTITGRYCPTTNETLKGTMPLPLSLAKAGFGDPRQARAKYKLKNGQLLKPLLIGSEGMTDTGKTEFALSIPGIIQMLSVDRNFQGVFDNPNPPAARNPNVAVKVFHVPMSGTAKIPDYQKYYAEVRDSFYGALENPDSQVVFTDGDSDFWELHILAHFGKTTSIYPATRYTAPYAEKRAQIARAWDSGKIVICSNKVKDAYETVYKPDGTPEKDPISGDDLRRKTGGKERQGFKDQDYLWDMQISHMFKEKHTRVVGGKTIEVPMQWGLKITKCKHNMSFIGEELWGDDCNFKGLVQLVYPEIPLSRWGF
jgi:hypothetical protein